MINRKMAILAVQKMHLDKHTTQAVHNVLGKSILVLNSKLENDLRLLAGVAVLNKDLVEMKELERDKLINGKPLAIKIKWKNGEETILINIYALNRRNHPKNFWKEVEMERVIRHLQKLDFMLGHFNITEKLIDTSKNGHPGSSLSPKRIQIKLQSTGPMETHLSQRKRIHI
jgi:hypothetical protein